MTRRYGRPLTFRAGLSIQAYCAGGYGDAPPQSSSDSWNVDLPEFLAFDSLDHAHSILHAGYLALLVTGNRSSSDMTTQELIANVHRRRAIFLPWLLQWEHCFHALLSDNGSSWTTKNRSSANALLANFHVMTIFAKLDETLAAPWACFSNEFGMIVDLCASVLDLHTIELPPFANLGRFPLFGNELSVMQPLYYAMARCTDRATRVKAGQLLLNLRKPARSSFQSALTMHEEVVNDYELWTLDDWLDFSASEGLHQSPAAFFGGMYGGKTPSSRGSSGSPESDLGMEITEL